MSPPYTVHVFCRALYAGSGRCDNASVDGDHATKYGSHPPTHTSDAQLSPRPVFSILRRRQPCKQSAVIWASRLRGSSVNLCSLGFRPSLAEHLELFPSACCLLACCTRVPALVRRTGYPPNTSETGCASIEATEDRWSAAVPWLLLVRTRCVAVLFCVSLEFGTATEATTLAMCRDCWCDHLRSIIMIVRPRYYSGQFGRCVRQQPRCRL